MDPELRVHLKDQPEIRAFHYESAPSILAERTEPPSITGGRPRKIVLSVLAIDPILTIKDRFISVVAEDARIKVRSIHVPLRMLQSTTENRCHHDTLDELRQRLRTGLMMDFTSDWRLEAYQGIYFPPRWYLTYSARARLIQLEQSQVVWQGVCAHVGNDPTSNRPTLYVLQNDTALLNAKLNEAADTCVQELTRQFLGK